MIRQLIIMSVLCAGILFFAITCVDRKNTETLETAIKTDSFPAPDAIDAMNNPSKHAWDLFLLLNHPAKDYRTTRGIPDSTKKIGDSGIVVWETWKHAGTEVFLNGDKQPPAWNDFSLDPYLSHKGKTFEASTAALINELNKPGFATESTQDVIKRFREKIQLSKRILKILPAFPAMPLRLSGRKEAICCLLIPKFLDQEPRERYSGRQKNRGTLMQPEKNYMCPQISSLPYHSEPDK